MLNYECCAELCRGVLLLRGAATAVWYLYRGVCYAVALVPTDKLMMICKCCWWCWILRAVCSCQRSSETVQCASASSLRWFKCDVDSMANDSLYSKRTGWPLAVLSVTPLMIKRSKGVCWYPWNPQLWPTMTVWPAWIVPWRWWLMVMTNKWWWRIMMLTI